MGTFRDADHLAECVGGLFTWASGQPELSKKLRETNLVVRLTHQAPDIVLDIDMTKEPITWQKGAGAKTPIVEFAMKADVAHRFWLGKVNLLIALAKRDIVARGPINQVIKILPILKPMYEQYPKLLAEKGYAELAKV